MAFCAHTVRHSFRAAATAAALALFAVPGAPAGRHQHDARAWPRGLATIAYQSREALRRALLREPATVVRLSPRLHIAQVRPHGDLDEFARATSRLPGIAYVERLALRYSTVEPAVVPAPGSGRAYEWQWAATHEDSVPDAVLRAASAVTIAVVDTGADLTAPDIAAKSPLTYNAAGPDPVGDSVGHGTFVSALAAGSVTNGEGVAGFGGDAELMVVQASAAGGSFSDVDEANAIVWAVDHGARIVNLSVAGTETSSTEEAAIEYAAGRGVLVVAAAGNEYGDGNPVEYPAALLQPVGSDGQGGTGLSVGASDSSGQRAGFSSTGSHISMVAPGEGVFSALPAGIAGSFLPVALPGSRAGSYGFASGTSFAAPQVAGAAALVWAANPLLTAQQVAEILKRSASGNGSWSPDLGYGVLDAAAAVARASGAKYSTTAVSLRGRLQSAGTASLSWAGRGAASYRVAVTQDDGEPRVLLASTRQTSASFALTFGHTYSFTVTALDAAGAEAAVSEPYVVTLRRVRSALELAASRTHGRRPLRVVLRARLSPAQAAVPASGRTIVLQALENGSWRQASSGVTEAGGRASWRFTLAAGTYRLRAKFSGTEDLAGATSRPVTVRVGGSS